AVTRTAASESRLFHERPIRFAHVAGTAVGIGEQVHRSADLLFDVGAPAPDLLARGGAVNPPEIGVGACVGPDVESARIQGADLIPGHPAMPHAVFTVPPRP